MSFMTNWITLEVLGNTLQSWTVATLLASVVLLLLIIVKAMGIGKVRALAVKFHVKPADFVLQSLEKTKLAILVLVALFAGSQYLTLEPSLRSTLNSIVTIALLLQAGIWAISFINAWIADYRERQFSKNPAAVTTMGAIGFISKLLIWSFVLLLSLDNLGVNITALVAGMGIGGIAVALALQNILGDLFSSLTIVLDRPFVVGDFLILGEHMGSVEHIGLKTTRIRSLSGEQIIFSNSDLLGSRIRNYGRMYERRVCLTLGVTYDTSLPKLRKIPDIIRNAIESQSETRFDRAHFKAHNSYSLDFEYVYYVLKSDYNIFMDTQQAINFYIHEKFESEGIEFAFPTQTIYVEGNNTTETEKIRKSA